MFVCPSCGISAPGPSFCTEHGVPLVDAQGDALLGTMVGAYRLARTLGRGGMGTVYLGVHPGIGSRVAVKVLLPVAAATPGLVERFFAEAKAVNVIRHESIVNVLDLAMLPDGRPYIMMEYLEGRSLAALFSSWRPLPLDVLVRSMLDVLAALGAAHAAGITHRDLKPDNVFVTGLGRIKVLDFGVAKLRPELGGMSDGTRTGALLGTPVYMSPEQALGKPVDSRSDLYSVGVMTFEGATGRVPFHGDALYELLHKHVTESPPAPRALRPDLPPRLEAVILRALAKRPEDRFQSSAEMRDALSPILSELPVTSSVPDSLFSSGAHAPATPLLPTFDAASTTLPAPVEPPARKALGIVPIALGGAAVMVAVVALVIASAGAYFAWSGSGQAKGSPDAGRSKTAGGFDVIARLPSLEQQARAKLPGARLVTLTAIGPSRDGTLDLSDVRNSVTYMFRSPEASRGSGKRKCMLSLSVSHYGTYDTLIDSELCTDELLPKPKCSIEQVLGRGPSGGEISSVTLIQASGKPIWSVVFANGTMYTQADDC